MSQKPNFIFKHFKTLNIFVRLSHVLKINPFQVPVVFKSTFQMAYKDSTSAKTSTGTSL